MTAGEFPKCGANKRQGGGKCGRTAGWGTDHPGFGCCKFHGGNTPNHRKAAHAAMADAEARQVLAELDVTPVTDPFAALDQLAGQAVAWQRAVAGILNRLSADRIRYEGASGAEQLRAEVALYERAMDRTAQILTAMGRLKLADRRNDASSTEQAKSMLGSLADALGMAAAAMDAGDGAEGSGEPGEPAAVPEADPQHRPG